MGVVFFLPLIMGQRKHGVPPGHFGLPLIGETLEWSRYRSKGPDQAADFFRIRVAKFGEAFKSSLLGSPTIVVNSRSANRLLFANENKLVTTFWRPSITRVFGQHSLLGKTGDEAKRIRSALMTFLKPDSLQKFTARVDMAAKKHVDPYWDGTKQVFWNVTATQYSADFFPEPLKFDPSRFEDAGPAPYTFIPFGGGPRMCPGYEFARMQTLVLLHNLVTRFRWRPVFPDERVTIRAVPYPVEGLLVWLERRS